MSDFGWSPSAHNLHVGPMRETTPAQQFEAEAVATARASVEGFRHKLAAEEAMKDTEMPLTHVKEATSFIPWNQLEAALQNERLDNQRLRRDTYVMAKRIEELEAEIDELRGTATPVLEQLERMAATLKTFYYAPLTLSAIQPILALCIELNEDIVEQRR